MSLFQPVHINKEALCVLKRRESGELFISYEKLSSPIQEQLTQLETKIRFTPPAQLLQLYHQVLADPVLSVIFTNPTSFCDNLWEPWQGQDNTPAKIEEIFTSPYTDKVRQFQLRILAYRLHHTYAKCRTDGEVLAYSHRMIGWRDFKHTLDENFSVLFITNFGFGHATHFCTRLSYKGVEIVPLSHWVEYRLANKYEIISCSSKHDPSNENWYQAMEYVKTACNMFRLDEERFVHKYIRGECDKLVNKLTDVANRNKFTFTTSGYHFVREEKVETLEGDDLYDFRGDKISGALGFIDYIRSFAHITNIQDCIQRIEQLNRGLMPVLCHRYDLITPLLTAKQQRYTGIKLLHLELSEENQVYYELMETIKKEHYAQGIFSSGFHDQAMADSYPLYAAFKIKYQQNLEEYLSLSSEISRLEYYQKKYAGYLTEIENYFNTN